MRLWSLHPSYLDAKGIVACWRESLLAKAVLSGRTRGYRAHPQLNRFRLHPDPTAAINEYLRALYEEAVARGYTFDRRKLGRARTSRKIAVGSGQVRFELQHLKHKLKVRDRRSYSAIREIRIPELHPLFRMTEGGIESWERGMSKIARSSKL